VGGVSDATSPLDETAAPPAPPASAPATGADPDAVAVRPGPDADLLGLIDRLAELLQRSELTELEIEAGGTGLILRKTVGVAMDPGAVHAEAPVGSPSPEPTTTGREPVAPAVPSVKAPLTGIFYASPAPGSAPYVQVGGEVAVGQIIGLIEAMKLFNEIKSDLAGRVTRVVPESGALVKAKQPLIEVEPL
jgi:acetyl-CoA carboxylase biotin carboxyl carrier protein